jgi:hypothetical protein
MAACCSTSPTAAVVGTAIRNEALSENVMGMHFRNGIGVPEPSSVVLLGSGLVGVLGLGWSRRRRM